MEEENHRTRPSERKRWAKLEKKEKRERWEREREREGTRKG